MTPKDDNETRDEALVSLTLWVPQAVIDALNHKAAKRSNAKRLVSRSEVAREILEQELLS